VEGDRRKGKGNRSEKKKEKEKRENLCAFWLKKGQFEKEALGMWRSKEDLHWMLTAKNGDGQDKERA